MKKTIRDVAAAAGVSPSTVSRFLNKNGYVSAPAYERILQAIKDLDYAPSAIAVSLSRNQTKILGVVIPDICGTFFNEVVYAVEKAAEAYGYRVLLCNSDNNVEKERSAIEELLSYKVGGLVIVPVNFLTDNNLKLINDVWRGGTPVVCVDRELPGFEGDGVYIDNEPGLHEIIDQLVQQGHSRFAVIHEGISLPIEQFRIHSIDTALQNNGLVLRKDFIVDIHQETVSYAVPIHRVLQDPEPPTAVLALSSTATVSAVCAIYSCGRKIPDDVLLVGFDDFHTLDAFGYSVEFSPKPLELGTVAARTLFRRLEHPGEANAAQRIVLRTCMQIKK